MTTLQTTPDTQITKIIEGSKLPANLATALVTTFVPFAEKAAALMLEADAISVTDATQVREIKEARRIRLELKNIRVEADKSRKTLKEDALRQTQAIDAVNRNLEERIKPVEAKLQGFEDFAERAEAARVAKLKAEREQRLAVYGFTTIIANLGEMKEEAFAEMLEGVRLQHEAKVAAAAKAEEERKVAEAARVAEEARVREENARLKKEADEREAANRVEQDRLRAEAKALQDKADEARRVADAAAKAERDRLAEEARATEARVLEEKRLALEAADRAKRQADELASRARAAQLRAEQDLKAKNDAEARERAEAERVRKAAALAPDATKLRAYAAQIRALPVPALGAEEAKDIVIIAKNNLERIADWVAEMAAGLEGGGS
jgi:hypothetical protein